MAFNIEDFKSNGLKNGGVRTSLFDIAITSTGLGWGDTGFDKQLPYVCKASSIPASTIQQVEVPYFGRQIKLAGDRTFDNWNVTILNDEDYIIKNSFERWLNKINSHVENLKTLSIYKCNATITQYSKAGNPGTKGTPIRTYTFYGLFPVSVEATTVDWGQQNQIQEFGVTFAYDYWLPTLGKGITSEFGPTGAPTNNGNQFNGNPQSAGTAGSGIIQT